jgi:hypothetical protein
MMCPAMIWICWISGVESDGACRQTSQRNAISPPVLPVKPTMVSRFCRAAPIARKMFGERPEVDIAIKTSPASQGRGSVARTGFHSRSHCRLR